MHDTVIQRVLLIFDAQVPTHISIRAGSAWDYSSHPDKNDSTSPRYHQTWRSLYATRLHRSYPLRMFIGSPLGQSADVQGFDNGWWGTILGSPRFLKDYGSCAMVEGAEVCNLSTPQLSAGSSVQSAGISKSTLVRRI
jgi:hypothetical protein